MVADGLGKSFRPGAVRFTTALPKTRSNKIMRRRSGPSRSANLRVTSPDLKTRLHSMRSWARDERQP